MKKFFAEFKEFISKGNVMDLAVGVIIGGAFSGIVTSLTDNIIKPLINCIGGAEIQGKLHLIGENYIDYGAFLSAVINFLIMALIIFCIVKTVNKAVSIGKKITEDKNKEEEKPTTKTCPFCKSEIPIDAVKCCHCTSDIIDEE
ncbi:MAG: large conductance mechanosensitive channel protein MscL [Eubacterium sp.]|nr:large conductance mechanosensitive channel protein MscL [Eubacterium sp.]MDE6768029.1 large conductance mechanosensitive channel protein MscL [Eubacterium sp.]